jgi:hypothetical protein
MIQAAARSPQLETVRHELRELTTRPEALHRASRLLVRDASPPRRVFLLVDQFEEVFTLCEKEELRAQFIAALLHAARERNGPVVVVMTMRADFYPRVAAYEELARVVDQHQFLVAAMNDRELRQAMEEPAIRAGAEFEPGLVETLLEDVRRQPGALPLLQHALLELWNRREDGRRLTHAAYGAIGKLQGAVERRANEVFSHLSADDQELSRRVFLRLVHLGEGAEDTKRRVQLRELLVLGGEARVHKLIESLTAPDSRLLVTEGGNAKVPGAFVEAAHETLIRSWSQLRKWLDADRAGLRTHRRLSEAAEDWEKGGKQKDRSLLYGGARLATAREWSERNRDDLSGLESEFLETSAKAERAAIGARRWSRVAAGFAVVMLSVAALSLSSFVRATRARSIADRSTAVVLKATELRAKHPIQSLLLACAAARNFARQQPAEPLMPAIHQSLRDGLSEVGGHLLVTTNVAAYAVRVSPNGKWLVGFGRDKTNRLWNLRSTGAPARPFVLRGITISLQPPLSAPIAVCWQLAARTKPLGFGNSIQTTRPPSLAS